MSRLLSTSGLGFFSRLANVRLLAGVREVGSIEENPTPLAEEPAKMGVREVLPTRRASIIAEDLDHHTEKLDAVAGSEFVDDRIRLRE
jgi:hypothetical protein